MTIFEQVTKNFDVIDANFLLTWKVRKKDKSLLYFSEKCVGCQLCKEICPVSAIEYGPIPQIATGEIEAPYILIDLDRCIFCGLCAIVCPTHAMVFAFNKKQIDLLNDYPKLLGRIEIGEECIPCKLCALVCPTEAFKLELEVEKKENLVIYKEEIPPEKVEGSIIIDKEKCTFCGLCEDLCEAIKITWIEPSGEFLRPGIDIIVDEDRCDYCNLCAVLCPSEAVKVECKTSLERVVKEPKISGLLVLEEEKCIYCGWCAFVCPVEAVKYEKPFEGEVMVSNLEKCDPVGCNACIRLCPTKAWYIPKRSLEDETTEKIAVNKDLCIFCGACQNSCPEILITVTRKEIHLEEEFPHRPWETSWKRVLNRLINVLLPTPQFREINLKPLEAVEEPPSPMKPLPKLSENIQKLIEEKAKITEEQLKTPKFRRLLEGVNPRKLESSSKPPENKKEIRYS
ncbi:MAG: 4Fe-4S binding protein [Candidatus Hodarchaeota archaeon]